MGYFRELPDLEYQVFDKSLKNSSSDYVRVKNFFRRVKLRNDLYNVATIFVKYQISEGARPETVAEELYVLKTTPFFLIVAIKFCFAEPGTVST